MAPKKTEMSNVSNKNNLYKSIFDLPTKKKKIYVVIGFSGCDSNKKIFIGYIYTL